MVEIVSMLAESDTRVGADIISHSWQCGQSDNRIGVDRIGCLDTISSGS